MLYKIIIYNVSIISILNSFTLPRREIDPKRQHSKHCILFNEVKISHVSEKQLSQHVLNTYISPLTGTAKKKIQG